jgi:hypothetical protein
MLLRKSSVITPLHPALRIALSIASSLSQPCSGITSGRYVAEKVCFEVRRGKEGDEENGEGASDDEAVDDCNDDGCENVNQIP